TYSEIYSLAKEFNQLKTSYQTSNDYELEFKEKLETEELPSENVELSDVQDNKKMKDNEKIQQFDNQIITLLQIETFQRIFAQHPIEENNEEPEKTIHSHYQINDIKPIVHALSGRRSCHALSFSTILNALIFIINYTNCYGLPLP
ncbi:22500_t:CDS:2, partial [Racocetra persica]